jgi:hypothetical protein
VAQGDAERPGALRAGVFAARRRRAWPVMATETRHTGVKRLPRLPVVLAAGAGVSVAVAPAAVWVGGGASAAIPGIPDAGAMTAWGLRVARSLTDVPAVATVGALLLVVVLLPGGRKLTATQLRYLGKAVAPAVLGGMVWWHRRRTLPALQDGRRRAFVRLAVDELLSSAASSGPRCSPGGTSTRCSPSAPRRPHCCTWRVYGRCGPRATSGPSGARFPGCWAWPSRCSRP